MNDKQILKQLIDNPLKPNASEWAMNCREILNKYGRCSYNVEHEINSIITFNGGFSNHTDVIVTLLKRLYQDKFDSIQLPPAQKKQQIFVAMQFNDYGQNMYDNAIKPAIHDMGFDSIKVNDEEYDGSIIEKIKMDINDSAAILADLTGNRGGVYYEAGIARGLQMCNHPIKLILSCNKEFFDTEHVHFDVQGDNIIIYTDATDYKQKLVKRLSVLFKKDGDVS